MKHILIGSLLAALSFSLSAAPLALHPENRHYFLYQEKPTVLITSGEHYGAVLNLDFDYVKYLDTLAADGLNLTRLFTGTYVEPDGAFNIARNTLAPAPNRYICPWARSDQPGYANGGNKFDLSKWDNAYFERLKDFVGQAAKRGIIVEVNLFCPMYEDKQWTLSPMNAANNVNGVGQVGKHEVYNLEKNGALQRVQDDVGRKIVSELSGADNVYFEICNEPYFGGVTMPWQHHIVDVITDAEKAAPHRHLISQNVANGSAKVTNPHPAISIFNFHYANPPTAVAENYGLNKAIGLNETGFKGTADDHYRMEAWEFMIAGGALYNNLDYSFVAGQEDGTFQYPPKQPGGGNPGFRQQLNVLGDFVRGFNFLRMKPSRELLRTQLHKETRAQLLAEPGQQYAAYLKNAPGSIEIDMPEGRYSAQYLNAVSGRETKAEQFAHAGGVRTFKLPDNVSEVALAVRRTAD
ncbi:cellulase family glycosylhydrolase [Verrucomicrobiota bacterium sgz303538]